VLYEVTHTTRYTYESSVSQCLNEVRLTPRSLPGQHVNETGIRVEPKPSSFDRRTDYFGNEVTTFAVFEKHNQLVTTASGIVEVRPLVLETKASPAWEQARNLLARAPDDSILEAVEFIFHSPFVSPGPELAEYARPTFSPGRPLVEALQELTHRIHEEFRYEPKSTSIETPLIDVLGGRHGVCQDFAHVMIGALRSLRLAARYVSGYVRSGGNTRGAQASHAWVAVFVPEIGWLSFDPTNGVMPSDGHITLAWGRDYGDVTPVKGVTLGGGGQIVEVEVFVKPFEQP
jgi:transglutaminase-like putative cysteine protease